MYAEQTAVSTDRLNVFEGVCSRRIHAGEGALQRSGERISTLIMRFSAGAFPGSHTRSLAAESTDRSNVFEGGGSPRIHAGEGALQRSGERISTLIMRFSAGAFPGSHTRSLAAVSTDGLNVFEGGGSPRIHAGEGALQRSEKTGDRQDDHLRTMNR
jgi:hypothetical protein